MIKCKEAVEQCGMNVNIHCGCHASVLRLFTCWNELIIFTVWVVQELVEPSEDLAHVILFKDLMHCCLQARRILDEIVRHFKHKD